MTALPRGARIACKCVGLGQVAHASQLRRHGAAILEQLLQGVLYWPPGRPAIDELRANPVARSEKSILREHLWADVACPRPWTQRWTRHRKSAVKATASVTRDWASMMRISIVPRHGRRRTSHHRNPGSGIAPVLSIASMTLTYSW